MRKLIGIVIALSLIGCASVPKPTEQEELTLAVDKFLIGDSNDRIHALEAEIAEIKRIVLELTNVQLQMAGQPGLDR